MFQTNAVKKIKTHILRSVTPTPENRAVHENMWKNIVEWSKPQMTIWRTRIACWMPKATHYTHSEYVTLTAFPLQQWLHEHASTLRYTYTACLVSLSKRYVIRILPVLFLSLNVTLYVYCLSCLSL